MDWIDITYVLFILLVIIAGIICIAVFVPKEREKRAKTENCYRYYCRGGEMVKSTDKASLYERTQSYFYIEKGPFEADGVADGIKGADDKYYKAVAIFSVYIPESLADTAANIFCKMEQEAIVETISETISEALVKKLADYSAETDEAAFKEDLRKYTEEKLITLGYMVDAFVGLKVSEDSTVNNA